MEEAWFDCAALSIGVMLEVEYYRRRELAFSDMEARELFGGWPGGRRGIWIA